MNRNPYIEIIQDYADLIQIKHTKPHFSWNHSMSKELPFIFDLGCGSGNFLMANYDKNPEANYIGVELKYKRTVKAARKALKREASRFHFLQTRAEDLAEWVLPESVDQIHVNFPDPWPKKRHHKNRLMNIENISMFNRLLKNSGKLFFKTDHREYFYWAKELLDNLSGWEVFGLSEDLHRSEFANENIMTEFETIFSNQNLPIFFVGLQKNSLFPS